MGWARALVVCVAAAVPILAGVSHRGALGPEDAFERCGLTAGDAAIPMDAPHGPIFIEGVTINGEGPFRFLLDTGVTGGVRLDLAVVERLGLDPTGVTRTGTRGSDRTVRLSTYEVESVGIPGVWWEGVRAAGRDLNPGWPARNDDGEGEGAPERARIDGILGYHLFRDWVLTLDYPGREVRVWEGALPRPDNDRVHAMRGARLGPTVPVRLGRFRANALVDSGSWAGILVASRNRGRVEIESERELGEVLSTVSGAQRASLVTLAEAPVIGGTAIEERRVMMTEEVASVSVGHAVLRGFVVSIDQASGRIEMAAARGASDAPEPPPNGP